MDKITTVTTSKQEEQHSPSRYRPLDIGPVRKWLAKELDRRVTELRGSLPEVR